jgi:hypothetical protein
MRTHRSRTLLVTGLMAVALLFGVACRPRAWIESRPLNPRATDAVTFRVTAEDGDGVAEIKIRVNGTLVKTCNNADTCTFMGGPYPGNDQSVLTYEATVKDNKGNSKQVGPYRSAVGRPWQNQTWIPVRGSQRAAADAIDVCFVGDLDYGGDTDALLSDVADKIFDNYFLTDRIKQNESKYKFFYSATPASVLNCGANIVTAQLLQSGAHCNAIAVLHKSTMQDCTVGNIFTAEGSETKAFVHESGHALFDLADEYEGDTSYHLSHPFPNIWPDLGPGSAQLGEQFCQDGVGAYGGAASQCDEFCDNAVFCGFGWWRYSTATTMMVWGDFDDPWGLPARKKLTWIHGKY